MTDYVPGAIPVGRYAQGERSPIVWVLLCAGCGGFAPQTSLDYVGFLSGQCGGCGAQTRELHRFRAWIDSAAGCQCTGAHPKAVGDLRNGRSFDEPLDPTWEAVGGDPLSGQAEISHEQWTADLATAIRDGVVVGELIVASEWTTAGTSVSVTVEGGDTTP